jgi:hypothetical protein
MNMAIYPYFDSSSSRKPPAFMHRHKNKRRTWRIDEDIKKGMPDFPASPF